MPSPEARLERSVADLTKKQSRYEKTRQVAFYSFGFTQIIGLILIIVLLIQFNQDANQRNKDAEGRAHRTQSLLQQISKQEQMSLNAQTLAMEKFFLEALAGKTPPPQPLPVFTLVGNTPSTAPTPASPAPSASPRPSRTPNPSPVPRPSPSPSPTSVSLCGKLGIPSVPVVC